MVGDFLICEECADIHKEPLTSNRTFFIRNRISRPIDASHTLHPLLTPKPLTFVTGYMSRRLMKALEDLYTHYDTTVRNAAGGIVQLTYGEDGMDPLVMEGLQGKPVDMDKLLAKVSFLHSCMQVVRMQGLNRGCCTIWSAWCWFQLFSSFLKSRAGEGFSVGKGAEEYLASGGLGQALSQGEQYAGSWARV